MQAAEHGATFPMAKKIRASMTHEQMRDFAIGSEAGKPQHVKKAKSKGTPKAAPAPSGPGNRYNRLRTAR